MKPEPTACDEFPYLCIDKYLQHVFDAQALRTALQLGVIDSLADGAPITVDSLAGRDIDRTGMQFLLGILTRIGVLESIGDAHQLTPGFRQALMYRDLIEAKLDMAALVGHDVIDYFPEMIADPSAFMKNARMFQLFDYDQCFELTDVNRAATQRWVNFTTALTKYESQACLQHYDFSPHRRMLDMGGNSGEFVFRILQAYPELTATVLDLPVVCEIGRQHLQSKPEFKRIEFVAGDLRSDALPQGYDLVSFKSVLHDWPAAWAQCFLANASTSLACGGTLLIFERATIPRQLPMPYSLIPILAFFRSFRSPGFYARTLEDLGFTNIRVAEIFLETPFFLLTAVKH